MSFEISCVQRKHEVRSHRPRRKWKVLLDRMRRLDRNVAKLEHTRQAELKCKNAALEREKRKSIKTKKEMLEAERQKIREAREAEAIKAEAARGGEAT